jgi:hypothetical protein
VGKYDWNDDVEERHWDVDVLVEKNVVVVADENWMKGIGGQELEMSSVVYDSRLGGE